jgi:hypothetical protein
MNRTVWIPANFVPAYSDVPRAQTGERRPLGGSRTHIEYRREQVGWSDCVIDGERLQADLQTAIEKLNSEGYDVLSITAIQSGRHGKGIEGGSAWGYGYGLTEGVIVLAAERLSE